MIDFSQVGFTYDGERFVLKGIDLSIGRGEFVCILGGNGSGKSTLAQHIDALLRPDEGCVTVNGWNTNDTTALYLIRSTAGLVFQNPDDQIVASIIENDVAFGPENLGVKPDELRRRVTAALAQVGLVGFEERDTGALSGGQKQRVALAGVLAMEPQILVLDEATAMIDPRGRKGLLKICRQLNETGMTVVMITHFMEEAASADRVVVLDRGRIVADGAPTDVLVRAEDLEHLHLGVPCAAKLAIELRRRGVPVSVSIDERALEDELCRLFSTR
ncbi:energy-coupling factor transporter ATPase [Gordonibacter sp. Marseille-P4307]|uniref:energy-coupling factor transporter ATPase n=1 Tax=Gordonibacter sp. Marseille-P4307 TaxID=2161815 RepID=UPI000F52A793|nr:energy-coupling factor transporter ATPase [Gordonibacter sp. Marseille-P4307]